MTLKHLLPAAFFAGLAAFAADPVNFARQPGAKLTADCHFAKYTPDKAADGDDSSKESRWVSTEAHAEHWLAIHFGEKREVNQLTLKFWTDAHISADFDIQAHEGNTWKTLREVRGNFDQFARAAFATTTTDAVRILFKKQVPDNMVRLYEVGVYRLEQAVDVRFSEALRSGLLLAELRPELILENREPGREVSLSILISLCDENGKELKKTEVRKSFKEKVAIPLPLPESYGAYSYRVNLFEGPVPVLYFPAANAVYKSSSPFGSHCHSLDTAFIQHAGIYWWRNHDVYGRWNHYVNEEGKVDWSDYDERLAFVKKNGIRECSVYLGAPRLYSTILPGEPVSGMRDWTYSYYPPSDLDAWVKQYLIPMAEKVKKASPYRANEVWNEAWSYYRLRGLHGTAGEAAEIFRISYEALKKADPDAPVYATDVKPEMGNNPYAFKDFGLDLFELGFLRYNDLLSYHSYGVMTYNRLEKLRRNMWTFGRDFDLWSTETAVEGKPAYMLMESLTAHRAAGNGKTFIYSGNRWAPLLLEGKPTLYLVVQAALCRTLGDALPLGNFEKGGLRTFVFANGKEAVAVFFTDSPTPVKVEGKLEDMFGRPAAGVSLESPGILRNAPEALVREAMAARFAFHASEKGGAALKGVAEKLANASDADFGKVVDREAEALRNFRRQAVDNELYVTGKAMDFLTHAQILLVRRSGAKVKPATTLAEMRKAVDAQWRAVAEKNGNDGILLNTERLTSRAQKEMQFAAMYDSDGDAAARDLWLACAAEDLANGKTRLAGEKASPLYKTKSYFRSHKRLIRSELYCFPNGRPQEAVITLANPFGHELKGELAIVPPAGWQADQAKIAYRVPPMSRQLLNLKLTAPKEFKKGEKAVFKATDEAGNFPAIEAELEVLEKIPAYPILGGALSTGELTGN